VRGGSCLGGPARRKGHGNNLVGRGYGLTDTFELARQTVPLDAFEPEFGFVGFFKHCTHLRGELGPGAGALSRSIVGRRGRSTPNKLFGDYPGFDSRNKIIDEIKDFIGELNGTIGKYITLTYYVIEFCQMQSRAFADVRC
jgi:hypothetical protein